MIFLIFEQKSFKPFLVLKLKLFAFLWCVSLFMRINLDTRAVLREYLTFSVSGQYNDQAVSVGYSTIFRLITRVLH